jgi:RsiW-degrading membrane proteinase PrsW (M82 family)
MRRQLSSLSIRLGSGPLSTGNVYFLFYLLAYGCLLLVFIPKTGVALLFPAYFLLAMLAVTSLNRTMLLGWVVMFFVYGSTAVPFLDLVLAWPIDLVFGVDSAMGGNVLVPILEETLKVLPLLLFLRWKGWRFRWTAGASDLMILGAASGAGFALWEGTLWGFAQAGYLPTGAADFILSSHAATPHLGPLYLFPSMDVGSANSAYIGHAAAAAFIGLALGLGRMLAGRRSRVAKILPVVAWLWVIFDHMIFNAIADSGRVPALLSPLYTLDAYGRLSSWAFYLLLVGTLVYERRLLSHNRPRMRDFQLERGNLKLLRGSPTDALGRVGQVLNLRTYLSERRGLAYGLHLYHSLGERAERQERRDYLEVLAFALAHWKGELEVSPSLPWMAQPGDDLAQRDTQLAPA